MRRTFISLLIAAAAVLTFVSASKPAKQSHGLDVTGMDKSVKPGDDFFAYTNGTWFKKTEIPPDRSSTGSFAILAEEANRRTVKLIQDAAKSKSAAGSETRKIGDYYDSFMDEKAIEDKGLEPLKSEFAAIAAITNTNQLSHFFGSQLRADVDPLNATNFHTDRLFGLWVSPDFDKPEINAGYILQGGLGMPDRDYYLDTDAASTELQAKYHQHIANVLKLAGIADAEAKAARIYDLEKKIAEAHVSRTDSMDVLKANNRWPLAQFATKAPGIDWPEFFSGANLASEHDLFVWHPSAVTGISALVAKEPLADWKDYLTYHAIDRDSWLLPKALADENFNFYGATLFGAKQQRERWKRAVDATNAALGDAVGKLYVKHYFPASSKAAAQKMVKNLVSAFRTRIDRLDWMTPATRAKAKAKLDTLYIGIGYPEKWRDYAGLEIRRGDAIGNARRSSFFDYRSSLAKLGKKVDKSEWWMTPQTVNALNIPLQNALNFPAAILEPPFFDAQAGPVQNYGGIGAVIGHEISHSFDDQGSQFDENGRLINWWTKTDFAHFTEAADRLVAQFNAYEPMPGLHVNGKLTLSENIADVAGVSASYDAYRKAYNGEAPSSQGFTGDQRFFVSFGQIWRSKLRPQALRNSILTNGHAPGEYRADIVRNVDAWYSAFNVKPGEKLYLAPKDRIRVW